MKQQMYRLDGETQKQKQKLFNDFEEIKETNDEYESERDNKAYKIELLEQHLEEQIMRNEKQSLMIEYLKSNKQDDQVELLKQQIDGLNQKLEDQKVLLENMSDEYGRLCSENQEIQQEMRWMEDQSAKNQQELVEAQKRYKGLKQQYKMLFIEYEKQQGSRNSQQQNSQQQNDQYKCKYEQMLEQVVKMVDIGNDDGIEQIVQKLDRYDKQMQQQQEQMQQQQDEIEGLQKMAEYSQNRMEQVEEKYRSHVQQNHQIHEDKDKQIKQQQQNIEQLQRDVQQQTSNNNHQLQQQIRLRDETNKQLEQQLRMCNDELQQLNDQLKQKNSTIEELTSNKQMEKVRQYRSENEEKEVGVQRYQSEQQQIDDKQKRISETNKYIISLLQHAIKEKEMVNADCHVKQQNQIVRLSSKLVERLSQKHILLKSEIEHNKQLKDKLRSQQINSQKQDEQYHLMKTVLKTMIQQMNGRGKQEIKNCILSTKQKNKENRGSNYKKYDNVQPFSTKREVLLVSDSSFYRDDCELDSRDLLDSLVDMELDFN